MNDAHDMELEAAFAADSDRFRDESFVLATRALVGRVRRRRRVLRWSAAVVSIALVGLASPWLIEAARLMSASLGVGFAVAGDWMRSPAALGVAALIAGSLLYRHRHRWL